MQKLEEKLGKILIEKKLTAATAESCTGGLISSKLTDVTGSSAYIKLNFVTYANEAKQSILKVKEETLKAHGAVSQECAYEMAQGLGKVTGCNLAICTTGIAGPLQDEGKPVGLIYIGISFNEKIFTEHFQITEKLSKAEMKERFANLALQMALDIILKEIPQ